jgi:hypothetical protein
MVKAGLLTQPMESRTSRSFFKKYDLFGLSICRGISTRNSLGGSMFGIDTAVYHALGIAVKVI